MSYFMSWGPKLGPILGRDALGDIDVLKAPDDPTPIGTASPVGSTDGGVAIWRLVVYDAEVAGHRIVLGREFRSAPASGRAT